MILLIFYISCFYLLLHYISFLYLCNTFEINIYKNIVIFDNLKL